MTVIQKRIVAPGHGTFSKPNPIYFAVHSTANPGATALNHVNYWSKPKSKQGGQEFAVHLVSDWKEAYQCVEFDRICWQVGNGNPTCIGLEICEATNRADFERGLAIARDVILQMLNRYGWTVDRNVRSHKWFTENYGGSDHIDPIPYFAKWGWTWDRFIQYLKEGDDMTPEQSNQLAMIYNHMKWNDKTHYSDMGNLIAQMPITYNGKTAPLGDRLAYIDEHTHEVDRKLDDIKAMLTDLISRS